MCATLGKGLGVGLQTKPSSPATRFSCKSVGFDKLSQRVLASTRRWLSLSKPAWIPEDFVAGLVSMLLEKISYNSGRFLTHHSRGTYGAQDRD